MRIGISLPPGLSREAAVELMLKALRDPTEGDTREIFLARADAALLREEISGVFERLLPNHETTIAALDEAIGRARGKRRATLLEERTRVVNRTEWMARVHLNRYYTDQFSNGKRLAGGKGSLQPNEREVVRRLVNNEMKYLMNALRDCETGEYKMDLERRGHLYGNAVDEAKWLGYLYADLSHDRYLKWVLEPAEHCIDCLWMAGRLDILELEIRDTIARRQAKNPKAGPTPTEAKYLSQIAAHQSDQGGRWGNGVYRAQELAHLGLVPQSAELECTTGCKCHLEDVERPEGKTKQKEWREPFQSLMPKEPTMLKRRTLQPQRHRLAELAEKWEHKYVRRKDEPMPK